MKKLTDALPNMKKEDIQKGLLTASQVILTGLGNGVKFPKVKKITPSTESAPSTNKNVKFIKPELHVHIEKWKYHTGMNCFISNYGRIKDTKGVLQTVCKKNGYIWYKGKAVHRLVMETFKPVPGYSHLSIDHINHNTFQNDIWNLRWMTHEENKEQDKRDKLENAPVEEVKKPGPTAVEEKEEPKDFILNTVKMNSKEARKIMINDKSIKAGGTSGVDKAINKAINTKGPVGFANYTLQYVGDK